MNTPSLSIYYTSHGMQFGAEYEGKQLLDPNAHYHDEAAARREVCAVMFARFGISLAPEQIRRKVPPVLS